MLYAPLTSFSVFALHGDANGVGTNIFHLSMMLTNIVFKLLLLHYEENTWQKPIKGLLWLKFSDGPVCHGGKNIVERLNS